MTKKAVTPPVGIALIGAGMIAKTHVLAISAMRARIQLVAVISQRPERAEYLAQHYAGASPEFTMIFQRSSTTLVCKL